MQIELRQLRQFLAVAELRSFTAAAARLNMTQPALTRAVQQLEDRYGVRLIERGAKTFELTRFGRVLAERARLVEKEIAHIDSEMIALKSGVAGVLNVGTGPSSIGYLPDTLVAFQRLHPHVRVRVRVDSMDESLSGLLAGDLDLICTALEFPRHRSLVCERLFDIRNVVIARRDHPLADRAALDARDLLSCAWAGFTNDELAQARLGAYFAASDLELPRFAVETNNLETVFAVLAQSDYLASIPSLVLPQARARGLVPLRMKGAFWSVSIGFAHLRTSQLPPATAAFVNVLRAHVVAMRDVPPASLDA